MPIFDLTVGLLALTGVVLLGAVARLLHRKYWGNPYLELSENELFSRLRLACIDEKPDTVRKILKLGRISNLDRFTAQSTLLCITSRGGSNEIFKILLEYGANKNGRTPKGDTPLICAARNGHVECLEHLLNLGVDANDRGHRGWTALHWASLNGRYEIAATLVAYGANIDAKTDDGCTCIFLGCLSGHSTLVEDMIKYGADVFTTDNKGDTPLHAAARQNGSSVRPLIKAQAPYQPNHAGETPIDAALLRGHRKFVDLILLGRPELRKSFHFDAISLACSQCHDHKAFSNIFKVLSELSTLDLTHFEATLKPLISVLVDNCTRTLLTASSVKIEQPSCNSTQFTTSPLLIPSKPLNVPQTDPTSDLLNSGSPLASSSTIDGEPSSSTTTLDEIYPQVGSPTKTAEDLSSVTLVKHLSVALVNLTQDVLRTPKARALLQCSDLSAKIQPLFEPLRAAWDLLDNHLSQSMVTLEHSHRSEESVRATRAKLENVPVLIDRLLSVSKCAHFQPESQSDGISTSMGYDFLDFVGRNHMALRFMIEGDPNLLSSHLHFVLDLPTAISSRNKFSDLIEKLTFEQKRNWLRLKLESEQTHAKTGSKIEYDRFSELLPSLTTIARDINTETPENLRGTLFVKFHGEEGVGAGVQREWFQEVIKHLVDDGTGLFEFSVDSQSYLVASDDNLPALLTTQSRDELMRFFGRLCAMAIVHEEQLSIQLSGPICKSILARPYQLEDMRTHSETVFRSMRWLQQNDNVDSLGLTFEAISRGTAISRDLKLNGSQIPVTDLNKDEYLRLLLDFYFRDESALSLQAIVSGFHDIIPWRYIAPFTEDELVSLISGQSSIDLEDWKANTQYSSELGPDSTLVRWFWEWMERNDDCERRKVFQFVTGSTSVPLGGFVNLRGVDTKVKFNIAKAPKDNGSLPTASTCFNMLKLPSFQSQADFDAKLTMAVNDGRLGFSFH